MPAVNSPRLRDRRDELDMSNADVAKLVNLSPRYLENIMSGTDEPSGRVIHRLARVLKIPVEEIRADSPTPKGDPSEPPVQPTRPAGPRPRPDRETRKTGPKRARSAA